MASFNPPEYLPVPRGFYTDRRIKALSKKAGFDCYGLVMRIFDTLLEVEGHSRTFTDDDIELLAIDFDCEADDLRTIIAEATSPIVNLLTTSDGTAYRSPFVDEQLKPFYEERERVRTAMAEIRYKRKFVTVTNRNLQSHIVTNDVVTVTDRNVTVTPSNVTVTPSNVTKRYTQLQHELSHELSKEKDDFVIQKESPPGADSMMTMKEIEVDSEGRIISTSLSPPTEKEIREVAEKILEIEISEKAKITKPAGYAAKLRKNYRGDPKEFFDAKYRIADYEAKNSEVAAKKKQAEAEAREREEAGKRAEHEAQERRRKMRQINDLPSSEFEPIVDAALGHYRLEYPNNPTPTTQNPAFQAMIIAEFERSKQALTV